MLILGSQNNNCPENFECFTVLKTKMPQDYQLEAFEKGLLRNIFIVLNTEAGKTLIASIILTKMHESEPDRMGFIIVDWVSLEYNSNMRLQVIKFEGCFSLRGKYDRNVVSEINHEHYDVSVATTGAFHEKLEKKYVDL